MAPCNAECPEYILINFKHREPLHLLKLKIVRNMILPFRCSSNFSLFSAHADIRNEYCSVLRFGRAFRVELYRMTKKLVGQNGNTGYFLQFPIGNKNGYTHQQHFTTTHHRKSHGIKHRRYPEAALTQFSSLDKFLLLPRLNNPCNSNGFFIPA